MDKILCINNSRESVLIDVGDGRLRLAEMTNYDSTFVRLNIYPYHVQRQYGEGDVTKAGKLVKNTDRTPLGLSIPWSRVKEFYVMSRPKSYGENDDVSAELF